MEKALDFYSDSVQHCANLERRNMIAIRLSLLLVAILILNGCTRSARLYNLQTGEVSTLKYSYSGSGSGKIKGALASGEHVSGEYVTVAGGSQSWGTIYTSVYGLSGTATSSASSVENKQRGTGIIRGNSGTVIDCEYVTSTWTGAGTGACRDNRGTLYRLMF